MHVLVCVYVHVSTHTCVLECVHVCQYVSISVCRRVHAGSHKTVLPSLHTSPPKQSLTFICLRAHDLASAIVKAEDEGWAVGLHITIETIIPFQPSDADGPRHVGQAKHLQLALSPQTGVNE